MEIAIIIFFIILFISILLICILILREVIFLFSPIFFGLNTLQWILYNPLRFIWRNPNSNFSNISFKLLLFSGIIPVYWIAIHILLTPIRLINAIYFNILLGWSINLYDSLAEIINPKLGKIRYKTGFNYIIYWLIGFPVRIIKMLIKNIFVFIEPIIMSGVDIVFPTFTMYHGTQKGYVSADITQKGRWLIGDGNYAGTGIYFGMSKKVAEYYADNYNTIILTRVTLSFNRPIATTSYKVRSNIGLGWRGDQINSNFPKFWSSVEHWREDTKWFEYCILQPISKKGTLVKIWRARPIALLQNNKLKRIWGGRSVSPSVNSIAIILFSWFLIFFIMAPN